ncbi:MAG TPA: flagellar basal-body MS-ring/collar protein FliF [Stellaceae bacterium]|nr:flagellar basal-body MS-ring/collar protein FliF [Stellaceae bacterium]
MNGLVHLFRSLGVARLAVLGMVAAASVGFFVFLMTRIATPPYGLLYADLDLRDSGQIVQKLEALSVPYRLRGQGTAIMVPADQVGRLRMLMADDNLPHGGSVGYEIFDKSDTLGTSSFVENIDEVRALEGELARTIASLNLIDSARVHLVLPRRELFSRDRQTPSASIVVKLRGAERLTAQQVAAIQHLVAAAVPELTPNRVAVIDTDGNLLARGDGDSSGANTPNAAEQLRVDYENRLTRKLQGLIERTVGPGKARVDVHVDMDFDRVTTNSESYDPNGQVVRSTQTVTDSNDRTDGGGGQPVSVSNNLPNAQTSAPPANPRRNRSSHNQETTNYEISKTVRDQVREGGDVKRISVAVVVDGSFVTAKDGTRKYEPRSPEEMKQLTELVRSAIGYDAKRGDTVDVANLRFAPVDDPTAGSSSSSPSTIMGFERSDLMRMGETLILALVAVLVILLVIRPLINRVLDSAAAAGAADLPRRFGAAGAPPALPAPGGTTALAPTAHHAMMASDQGESIDVGQVEGRVAASSLRKVAEIVDKHPEEAISIVRSWMYQDAR